MSTIQQGVPLTDIPNLFRQPPILSDMQDIHNVGHTFMIKVEYCIHSKRSFTNQIIFK